MRGERVKIVRRIRNKDMSGPLYTVEDRSGWHTAIFKANDLEKTQ